MFLLKSREAAMPEKGKALKGRSRPLVRPGVHFVNGQPLDAIPGGSKLAMFGMGCFWGVERLFWQMDGVKVTAVGYANGYTPNPTYEEVCSGLTGHNEVVRIVFDPSRTDYAMLLKAFWENHDPTQGMRQGPDMGTQYRSGIYCYGQKQLEQAKESRRSYEIALKRTGREAITTEICEAPVFYFAEDYHQQYLAKVPGGYCSMRGTGVSCPMPAREG